MELTHLKYFVKLADTLNFTEASRLLFITQSTLSQSIRQTEEYLGIPLFERIGKKVYLTEAGKEFLPYARKSIEETESGVQRLRDIQKIYKGELCIGVIHSLCPLLAEAASRFSPSYPDIRLKLYHSSSINELANMIHDRKIDLALSYQPTPLPTLVESTKLTSVPLCLIVRSDSPLAALPRISLKAASELPLVLLEYGMYVRGCIEKLAEKNDVRFQPKAEANNSSLILQMVRTGKWSSVSSPEIIRQIKDLTAIPIIEAQTPLTVSLLWLKGGYRKAAAQEFARIIDGLIKEMKCLS